MRRGIRDLLLDYLLASTNFRPFTKEMSNTAGINTFDFTLNGNIQHLDDKLRIFIAITDAQGRLFKQFALAVSYPDHRDFFLHMAHTAEEILHTFGAEKKSTAFDTIEKATSLTSCYEAYSKGRQLFEASTVKKVEEAIAWFEKAKGIDFRSPLGYEGLIDAYTFLGFVEKQNGKSFGGPYQRAQATLVEMTNVARPGRILPSLEKKPKPEPKEGYKAHRENRFLKSHAFYVQSMHARETQNLQGAAAALREAVALVPEDAIAWKQLADVYMKLGDPGYGAAMNKGLATNPCLER